MIAEVSDSIRKSGRGFGRIPAGEVFGAKILIASAVALPVLAGRQHSLDTRVEGSDTGLQLLDGPHMLIKQEPMMLADTARESLHQRCPRAAETLAAKRGELLRIRLPRDHCRQDASSAGT